jgi:hypothetical protein
MDTETPPAEVRRSRSRGRYNAAMKMLRRAHMYAGLSLKTFVLLYGLTDFLFNHPESGLLIWWQMKPLRRFGAFVMVVSLIGSIWLVFGMHAAISK